MKMKILIVDVSASDRMILENLLCEHEVLTVKDRLEAFRILEENDGIDLLIIDINKQNNNGFQILEFIKENERLQHLRIIILTNNNDLENEMNALRLGATDFIRKPIYNDALKARIDIHISLLQAEKSLRKIHEQVQNIDKVFEQFPIGIVISETNKEKNLNETIIKVNLKFEEIISTSKDELINNSLDHMIHPDDLEENKKNFTKLLTGEIKLYSLDQRFMKRDGSSVWVHRIVAPLISSNVQTCSYISLVQDITECKKIEKEMKEMERTNSVFLSHLPGLAYRCNYDHNWTMQYVSQGCYNLTGYFPESLLYNRDLSYNDLISPEYREALWNEWRRILANKEQFKYEYEIITATGERKWVLELGQGIYNENGEVEGLAGIILDISDRKQIENTLKYSSEHDKWTGLYNREYLISLLEKDLKLKKKIKKALIGVNLSTIQLLVANYGYQYTQNLIKKAAEALSKHCTNNCLLFYPRENRFIFYIFDYKNRNELIDLGYVISETLESLFFIERIAGGIGILEIDDDEDIDNIEALLRRLLIASDRYVSLFGKDMNLCFYDEKLESLVNRERDIAEVLKAIAVDDKTNNDLFLQYQPILNLQTGSIFGFEALARLKTEKFGLVSPLEFIAIAEKTKLIFPIGEKIIIKALSFLKKLKSFGYDDISVSINISIIQLLKPDFISRLFELINEMGINKKNIGIEITESVFANDYDSINGIIEELRDAGLYIAIDDFGTGYSSLAREKELKADCMKIDKYFVDDLLDNDLNKAITGDIISMAHKLGHTTIAEGVEHESQMKYLKEHKCDKIQGYYISKPMDENDAIEFLQNYDKTKYVVNM